MKITYNTHEEYLTHHSSAHDAILYWKKMRQEAEGKIQMYVTPADRQYDVEYCNEKMKEYALVLKAVEDSIHPDYDMDGKDEWYLLIR